MESCSGCWVKPALHLLLPSADLRPGLIHLAHHRKSCSVQRRLKLYKIVCKSFLQIGFEGSCAPCRSRSAGPSTAPQAAGVPLSRRWYRTGSQGSCSGFNFTLAYLSVLSLPFSFHRASASLRPWIMVFNSPLPSAVAWWIKGNLARQGLLLCRLLFISPSCSVCLYSTPLIWLLHVSLPGACSCPSYCPNFHFPNFCKVLRGVEPLLFAPCQTSLIAAFSPASRLQEWSRKPLGCSLF